MADKKSDKPAKAKTSPPKKAVAKKRKPALTAREIQVIKAKVKAELSGKSQNSAAIEVFPNQSPAAAAVSMSRVLKGANVQDVLADALAKHGISIDAALEPVADGLKAVKEVFTEQGVVQSTDHATRLNASKMALKLLGIDKSDAQTPASVHFHQHIQEKKADYDL